MLEAQVKLENIKSGDIEAKVTRVSNGKDWISKFSSPVFSEVEGRKGSVAWHVRSGPERPFQVYKLEDAIDRLDKKEDDSLVALPDPKGVFLPTQPSHSFKAARLNGEEKSNLKKHALDPATILAIEDLPYHTRSFTDKQTNQLRMVTQSRWSYLYSDYKPFEDKVFPTHVTVLLGEVPIIEATLALGRPTLDPNLFSIPANAETLVDSCGGKTDPGKLIKSVHPEYPIDTRRGHIQGSVVIFAVIGTNGSLVSPFVISAPDAVLASSSLTAVKQWQYQPYTICGQPTEVETEITINYSLGG